jgi:hypothetical protein
MAILTPVTLEELKELQAKILFSRTDKVTKVTDGSVVNGFLFGNAKGAMKVLKDIAISQSHYYPDDSSGDYLDNIAVQTGIPQRFGSLGSSTYIRLHGDIGTTYVAGSHTFRGTEGVVFDLQENAAIGNAGFTYAKIASQSVGVKSNVPALSLKTITNPPVGHLYCINDYKAIGGRDIENDQEFRQRIKDSINIVALGTLERLNQAFISQNSNILRVFNHGTNGVGKLELAILTQNGANLSQVELDALVSKTISFFSMSDLNLDWLTNTSVVLRNAVFTPIDVSLRVQLDANYNPDEVRLLMQIRMNKYIDYRVWKLGKNVEWDDLLQIAKSTRGVLYVPDNTFVPRQDVPIPYGELPRIRGFEMRDLAGNIIADGNQNLNPVYFPNSLDFNFIRTVLRTI